MCKLYLVSYYFAPLGRADGVNRTYLVKYLSEMGWDIDVVTGKNYRSVVLNFQQDPALLNVLPGSINIQRFKSDQDWLMYDLKKTLNIRNNLRRSWIQEAVDQVQFDKKGIIYAVVPAIDNAVLAYQLAEKHGCPLVLHLVDDTCDIDPAIVKRADLVFGATEQIQKNTSAFYGIGTVLPMPNGITDLLDIPEQKKAGLPVRIAYAGSLNFRTQPEIFARACQRLIKQDPAFGKQIEVDFYGPRGYYPTLRLTPYLGPQIRFKGYLSFNELMRVLTQYDMALASVKGEISFVSKVYHYLNAGLPIFALDDCGGLRDFVEQNQIGTASSLNIDDVTGRIKAVLADKDRISSWRGNVLKIRHQYGLKESAFKMSEALKALQAKI